MLLFLFSLCYCCAERTAQALPSFTGILMTLNVQHYNGLLKDVHKGSMAVV